MTIAANLLLGLASLLTVLVVLMVADARHAAGADAMGLVLVPMLLGVRWLALAGAITIACSRSALGWLRPSGSVQAAIALTWLALAGAASFASVMLAYGPDSGTFKPWAFALAVVVPACVIMATAVAINGAKGSNATWRLAAGVLSLAVVSGGVVMSRHEWIRERGIQAAAAASEAEHLRWLDAQRQALQAVSPQAPLREWLPWLNVSIDELREPALLAVRSRPTLERDLAEMLRGDEGPEALRFLWLWLPDSPPSLSAPSRDAIAALPAWAESVLSTPPQDSPRTGADGAGANKPFPPRDPVDLSDMAQAAIVIADRYVASGHDFVTPIREFAAVLERHKLPEEQLGEDVTYQPRAYLDTWLEGRGRPGSE